MTSRFRTAGGSLLLPALFCFCTPAGARAQQWTVDAAAGRAVYDPVATRLGAATASLGVRYEDGTRRWLYLSGGTDLGAQGLRWGAGGVGVKPGTRWRGVELGVELSADLYGYSGSDYDDLELGTHVVDPGGAGATLQALPSLTLRRGGVETEAYSGVVQSLTTSSGGARQALTGYDGGVRVSASPVEGLRVGALGRLMYFPEGGYPYLGASASYSRGRGRVWAFGGRWLTDLIDSPREGYGVGGEVSVTRGTAVQASWQQEPSDPVYLNPARRTWSVRVSQAIGRAPRRSVVPVVLPAPASGPVAIRIPLAEADSAPSVLGDFTDWKPVPMTRAGDFWEVRLPIAPGVHHYGFRRADGTFFIPASLPKTDDGMGGESAVLVVS